MAANLFSDVAKFGLNTINQGLTGPNLKDYAHASKLFVADQYRLLPKFGFLYYVFIDINPAAASETIHMNPNKDREIGMLVKSVSLPKFTVDLKKYNAYNRPNFVQNKISYDPINIIFHDDSANVIRNFWFDYYHYHYRDADYTEELYRSPHKYDERRTDKWGLTTRNINSVNYLNSIRIYSLHQKRFSEYVLINPLIKSFRHGEHQSNSNELLQHDMSIEYESVLYYYGDVTKNEPKGFVELHYDRSPSPLTPAGGGTKSILGPGGIMQTVDEVAKNLAEGNYKAAAFLAAKGLKNASSMDLKKAAINEVLAIGKDVLRGNNPTNNIFIPSFDNIQAGFGSLGAKMNILPDTSGVESSSGPAGWLAGVKGKFSSSDSAETSSAEITAATAATDGNYPTSASTEFPGLNEDPMGVPPVATTQVNSGEPSLDSKSAAAPADSNQQTQNPQQSKRQALGNVDYINNEMVKLQEQIQANQEYIKGYTEITIPKYEAKYNEAVALHGADSKEAKSYNKIIERAKRNIATNEYDITAQTEALNNLRVQREQQQAIADGIS